jgi:hypothetical protein
MHLLSRKVLFQRAVPTLVVLQSDKLVCRKRTRKDGDETEGGFERLVKDIAHFVLKVLRCNQRVEKILSVLQHGFDLTAGTGAVRIDVKGFPELVDGVLSWSGTGIDENANVWLEALAEGLEKPSVRIDLLLVLFFQAEENLDWCDAALYIYDAFFNFEG